MSDQEINKHFKSSKDFHKARLYDTLEQKYLRLIELQKLALEIRRSKNLPIKNHEKVWPIQF